jgi:glycosyltransferase involved in cell wall biosynthesis
VADSHFTARELTTVLGVAEAKIRIIHCGIGPQYQPCAQVHDMEPMRRRYGLPDAFIFFLGVLEPKKNLERTISAYADLRRRRKDVPRLVIGGGRSFGWKNRRVFALARSLGDAVLFTDFIAPADLPAVYGMAEMLVFPSLYEGFGLPPVEAMACGTPVISSNRAALPEIAGDAALLVDPLRTDDIADAMERILVDSGLRAELQERGRINARRFDWRQAARTMLKVFDEAVGGTS